MPLAPIVLVIDENPRDAHLLHEAFVEAHVPVHVESIQTGTDAVCRIQGWGPRFAARKRPDLVLIELRLPKLDGTEVLAFIKGQTRHRTIPTLMFSSSLPERVQADCRALGADACLEKPDAFVGFGSVVETILDHLAHRCDDSNVTLHLPDV